MKKFFKGFALFIGGIIGFILSLLLLFGILFGFGKVGNAIESTIGIEYKNIKREQFENSTNYVHGMTDRLSEYKRQYELEKDINNKIAIINTVDDEFASFDDSKINNSTLRNWLIEIRSGSLNTELQLKLGK